MLYTLRFFSLQNAVCFIMLTCLVPVLFTFYILSVLKLKKNIIIIIPAPKGYVSPLVPLRHAKCLGVFSALYLCCRLHFFTSVPLPK